jgi:hypothetical protein
MSDKARALFAAGLLLAAQPLLCAVAAGQPTAAGPPLAGSFPFCTSETVAHATAAKVAAWTWNVFRVPEPLKARLKGAELAMRLAEGGRKTAAHRKSRSEQVIVACCPAPC